jgi:hypothetical protein
MRIPGATCGKPRAKTSCARSTPPERRSPSSSQKATLFKRRHTKSQPLPSGFACEIGPTMGTDMDWPHRSSGISRSRPQHIPCLTFVLSVGVLLAGRTTPNPDTAAGQSEIAGQKCTVCVVEIPGDVSPCYAICSQRLEDQAAYQRALGR